MPVSSLRNPAKMDQEDWTEVTVGMGRIVDLDVWVVDASKLTVEQIRAISGRHKRANPNLSLILVDYLGLIEKPKAERNDLAIGHISASRKQWLRTCGPLLFLSVSYPVMWKNVQTSARRMRTFAIQEALNRMRMPSSCCTGTVCITKILLPPITLKSS